MGHPIQWDISVAYPRLCQDLILKYTHSWRRFIAEIYFAQSSVGQVALI